LLETLSADNPHLPCLVITSSHDVRQAVELMRRGAYSVVTLPLDGSHVATQVTQALRHRDLSLRNQELSRSLDVHERLAMIGKLAAGVAHELNSPLDGVLRFVNLAVDSMPKDAQQIPYLVEARRGLRRMADIVRDLLQFSRNAAVEIADEDAERMARDAVAQVVEQERHKRIETAFSFPAGGIQLPRGMFQVLGNLAKNAVDAMPNGGSISVSASLHDGLVRVDVRDTGTGIPEEIHDRVFEPFFTTKEVGRGTGLGLSICQRIVERLGGSMSMQSVAGQGTTVVVELPARRRMAPPLAKPTAVSAGRRE
jgi:signal transduction histidine kinase